MNENKIRITNENGVAFTQVVIINSKNNIVLPKITQDFFSISLTGNKEITVINCKHKHDKKTSDLEQVDLITNSIVEFIKEMTNNQETNITNKENMGECQKDVYESLTSSHE